MRHEHERYVGEPPLEQAAGAGHVGLEDTVHDDALHTAQLVEQASPVAGQSERQPARGSLSGHDLDDAARHTPPFCGLVQSANHDCDPSRV
jgi:hypothetical protein